MHKKFLSCIVLLVIYSLSTVSGIRAESSATQKITNSGSAAYADFLSELDSSSLDSILKAKNELLSRFRGKENVRANDAFRAFSKFYDDTISDLEIGFSSKPQLQEVLAKIGDATGLDNNPFPAFDKLDTVSVREIKKKYACVFRSNSGTHSAAIQAAIPLHFGHPLTHKTTLG